MLLTRRRNNDGTEYTTLRTGDALIFLPAPKMGLDWRSTCTICVIASSPSHVCGRHDTSSEHALESRQTRTTPSTSGCNQKNERPWRYTTCNGMALCWFIMFMQFLIPPHEVILVVGWCCHCLSAGNCYPTAWSTTLGNVFYSTCTCSIDSLYENNDSTNHETKIHNIIIFFHHCALYGIWFLQTTNSRRITTIE